MLTRQGAVVQPQAELMIDTIGSAAVGAAASAVISGVTGKISYATGFEVTFGADGTGVVADTLTLASTASGFHSLSWRVVTTGGAAVPPLVVVFPYPVACQTVGADLTLALGGVALRSSATIVLHGFVA